MVRGLTERRDDFLFQPFERVLIAEEAGLVRGHRLDDLCVQPVRGLRLHLGDHVRDRGEALGSRERHEPGLEQVFFARFEDDGRAPVHELPDELEVGRRSWAWITPRLKGFADRRESRLPGRSSARDLDGDLGSEGRRRPRDRRSRRPPAFPTRPRSPRLARRFAPRPSRICSHPRSPSCPMPVMTTPSTLPP